MSEWISFKERFPRWKGKVLVYINGHIEIATVVTDTYFVSTEEVVIQVNICGEITTEVILFPSHWKKPTHWYPIPEPMEELKDE